MKQKLSFDINYGEIHKYYPLKFNPKQGISKINKRIINSDIIYSEKYIDRINSQLEQIDTDQFKQKIKDEINELEIEDHNIEIINENVKKINVKKKSKRIHYDKMLLEDIVLKYDDTDEDIMIYPENKEHLNLEKRFRQLEQDFHMSKTFFGDYFINTQDRYTLLPIKIRLNNDEIVWINVLLYIFSNNTGILKFEIPIKLVNTEPLLNNDIDEYIKEVNNNWNSKEFNELKSFYEISRTYATILSESTKIDFIKYDNSVIDHIVITDFDEIPSDVNDISNELKEKLYGIAIAPLPDRQSKSYIKEARNHFANYSLSLNGTKNIIKTTGSVITISDDTIINQAISNYKIKYNTKNITKNDYFEIQQSFTKELILNSEFSIILTILKKITNMDYYISGINLNKSKKDLHKIRHEYNRNKIFISELQEGCYGSVVDQSEEFEKMFKHYLQLENIKIKMNAIDNIINQHEQMKRNNFQDFLAIGGLLMSIIFGFPAIYETVSLIRIIFYWIPNKIPSLNLIILSFIIWIICNLIIFYKILSNKKRNFKL